MSGLSHLIQGVLALAPAEEALEFQETWYCWADIATAKSTLQGLFESTGAGAGARVGMMLRNRPEFVPAILDVVDAERCLVTLNTLGGDEKLAAEILRSEVPVVVGGPEHWAKPVIREAVQSLGALGIEVGISGSNLTARQVLAPCKALWKRPVAADVAVEMLSSGTTGTPKRIPLPRETFTQSVLEFLAFEKGGIPKEARLRSGVQFLITPFSHIGGLGRLLMAITSGRKSCLFERFEIEAFRKAIVRHRPKVVSGPPTVLRMLLDADTPREELESLVAFRTGMAPLDPDLADAFMDRYGIAVLQNYGATEFAGGIAGWTMEDFKSHRAAKRGSVGRLNAGVEGRTLDPETGETLPPGQPGLLEIRAPHIYAGRWIKTTDLAIVDPDRFLWLKGRADNAIIRGGFKVLPDEVAQALQAHPSVAEAAVVGVADTRLGQVPAAAVVLKPNAPAPDPEDLKVFLRERLSSYQIPVFVKHVPVLPRLESLKVDTAAIRKLFTETPHVAQ